MAEPERSALVDTDWLAARLGAPDIRVCDATWYLPGTGDGRADYDAAHIPGAVHFDIDAIKDKTSDLPHMVPSAEAFSSAVRKLGLGDGTRIVVYDNNGFLASARVWWMFRLFGHRDVVVLDGGMRKWREEGHPVDDMPVTPGERHFTARQNNLLLREIDQVRANLTSRREQVLDARSKGRFTGAEPEVRPGLRGGHIPGSANLFYGELIGADGCLRPRDELRALIEGSGVDLSAPIVTSCGSGVSAAVINLALFELGREDVAVYDGSWTEWGGASDTPVAL